jgi:hypothetical protein
MYLDDGLGIHTDEGIWLQKVLKAIDDIEFYITKENMYVEEKCLHGDMLRRHQTGNR